MIFGCNSWNPFFSMAHWHSFILIVLGKCDIFWRILYWILNLPLFCSVHIAGCFRWIHQWKVDLKISWSIPLFDWLSSSVTILWHVHLPFYTVLTGWRLSGIFSRWKSMASPRVRGLFLVTIGVLSLSSDAQNPGGQGSPPAGQMQKRFEYKYSFKPPYLAQKDGTVPFFEYSGSKFFWIWRQFTLIYRPFHT